MDVAKLIKSSLEETYDIPFDVKEKYEYNDPAYILIPSNEFEELFSVSIYIRQGIRLIVEIEPQKYAADFVHEVNHASEEKKAKFLSFWEIIKNKGARMEFYVNQVPCDPKVEESWNSEWKQIRIRMTKIVAQDDDSGKESYEEWSVMTMGLMLSLLDVESLMPDEKRYEEGAKSLVLSNKYERNPINREICLAANGVVCKICGFDFEKVYGKIGKGFIHVHHIETVASHGGAYYLNPITDMIPVCPNCHAMLHRKDPPYLPEEIKQLIFETHDKGEAFYE